MAGHIVSTLEAERGACYPSVHILCFFYVSLCLGPWDGATYIQGRSSFFSQCSLETQTDPELSRLGVSQAHQVDSIDM